MSELFAILKLFSDNVHVLGWAALIFVTLKLSWRASKFFDDIVDSSRRVRRMEDTVETLATNHLPHIQREIEILVVEIKGLRSDLFQLAIRKD